MIYSQPTKKISSFTKLFIIVFTLILGGILYSNYDYTRHPRIAHAGGSYLGLRYTNSLEALNFNSSSYDYFELDFNFTSDDHLVCAHNWQQITPKPKGTAPTLAEFIALKDSEPFERCTIDSLAMWLGPVHINC